MRCEPRSHAVDGLARSDVTDRSPLHSGTKPGTRRYKARYKVRYKARYKVAQGGTKQHVQVCCQGVCGAEAKHPRGRSQTSRGGGPRWQVPQAVRTLEPARGWWQRTPRVAVPAHRPLSLARHRAHQTEVLMRSTASGLSGRPKNNRTDANTCLGGGEASKPGPTCNATELLGSRPKERSERAVQTPTPPGPTTRARESAGEMEHSRPCCRDPQLPMLRDFLG